jgi:hypothetical protein
LEPKKLSEFTNKEIRTWAWVTALILTVIGLIQFLVWSHQRTATIFWIIAATLFLLGLVLPILLRPIYWLWMKLAVALAWFNTRLVMFLVFYLVFTPVGIILRVFGKDLIKQKWGKRAESYWIRRPDTDFDVSRYEKQY